MRGLLALVLAWTLSACGGGGAGDAREAKAAPSSASTQPAVSLQTTCDFLFLQGEPALWDRATKLGLAVSNGQAYDEAEAQDVAEKLQTAADSAGDGIQPFVQGMADEIASLPSLDVPAYKTSATEVGNQCAPLVADSY